MILVTGGAGFIGFNFVKSLLADAVEVAILDNLTYAGNERALAELGPRVRFIRGDICDAALVRGVLVELRPAAIVHFAAESHVDRSIDSPEPFIRTNIEGTFRLLEETRRSITDPAFRFVHVSTDEVFGSLGATGEFTEDSAYAPRSPYAASKAASDHLVSSYVHTYNFPAIITNCSNNYGPYQFPEKLIPLTISNALRGEPLPVYGEGANVRDWIHVDDHCAALRSVLARGRLGEHYLIGARGERRNLEVVHAICDILDELRPRKHRELIRFVTDRAGHDFRYAIDPSKIERELGWRATVPFEIGLRRTVEWYLTVSESP